MTGLSRRAALFTACGLLAAAATLCSEARSDTEFIPPPNWLAGAIQHDTTLTAAAPGPNYYLYGDLVVPPGITLTIEPGVTMTAAGASDFFASGRYRDRIELIVNGALIALGAPGHLITFDSDVNGNWAGIYIAPGGTASLDHAQVSAAIVGLELDGSAQANHSSITSCNTGIHCTGQFQLLNSLVQQCSIPVRATGSTSALTLAGTEVFGAGDYGISCDGGQLDIGDCYIHGVSIAILSGATPTNVHESRIFSSADGVRCYAAGATITSCEITASAPSSSFGLYLAGFGGSVAGGDSAHAAPTKIFGYQYGIYCDGPSSIRNVLIALPAVGYGSTGISLNANNSTVNYCTIDGATNFGVTSSGVGNAIYNTLITRCGYGVTCLPNPVQLNYSDLWQNQVLFNGGIVQQGPKVSVFDPGYLMSGTDPFELANVSLFTDFSVSGGQIGAYGPGAGNVTPIVGASLLSAETVGGVAKLVWYVEGQSGNATTVYKRTPNGEWGGIAAEYADGTRKVAYEDRDVVPGSTYEYGLGVRGATGVEIQGLATLRIPSMASSFLRLASANPSKGRTLSLDFGTISGGLVKLQILDISGRQIQSNQLAVGDAGTHSTQLAFGSGLTPGVYWVRMVAPSQVLKARFCVVN